MRFASILRWTALALLGLAIAAGVAFAASKLVSQRIGLASQPLNAGKELAPPESTPRPGDGGRATTSTATQEPPTTTVAPPSTVTTAPPASGSGAPSEGSTSGSEPDD